MDTPDTICAVATPAGEGAVGIVRLSGPRALEAALRACGRRRLTPRRMQAAVVYDPDGGGVIDRVLVCFMPGPGSYTGEDVVEVHGHGGTRNIDRLLRAFLLLGCRVAAPGEFTRRAFLNGRLDLVQAEAVAQIVSARSERALKNAQAALSGALGERVRQLESRAVELAARLEACVDFGDDTAGEVTEDELERRHGELEQEIVDLARTYERGRRLQGVRVGIVGPVNAGKSSLFNRLLGMERAVVDAAPGTTRDYLEGEVEWEGLRVTLMDTAGERAAEELNDLERAGRELAAPVLRRCDLLLYVVDISGVDVRTAQPAAEECGAQVVVANKADRLTVEALARVERDLGQGGVLTSATQGSGLDRLKQKIVEQLFPRGGEPETVQVAAHRQWEALERAARAIGQGRQALGLELPPEVVVEHARDALRWLGEITGQGATEAVLDHVFQSFCVGK